QPSAGFILNGVKPLERQWRPVLCDHWHCTLAELLEQRMGISPAQIQALLQDRDKFSLRVIAGNLVETGDTLLCPENLDPDAVEELEELDDQALLSDLLQKYLTVLAKPHRPLQPVPGTGGKDIFQPNPWPSM
ncbi:hypothetical protein FD755_024858, partial [Muntiacus reevesi]